MNDWEVQAGQGPARLAAMISVRLDPDAAGLVRRAAREAEITQSEFIRRAAVGAAQRALQPIPVISWAQAYEKETQPQIFGGMTPPASTASSAPIRPLQHA